MYLADKVTFKLCAREANVLVNMSANNVIQHVGCVAVGYFTVSEDVEMLFVRKLFRRWKRRRQRGRNVGCMHRCRPPACKFKDVLFKYENCDLKI